MWIIVRQTNNKKYNKRLISLHHNPYTRYDRLVYKICTGICYDYFKVNLNFLYYCKLMRWNKLYYYICG